MPRLHKKAPCPQRIGQAAKESAGRADAMKHTRNTHDRQAAHTAPPAGRIEARLLVLMAWIMVMMRWLRLAVFMPFSAPAGAPPLWTVAGFAAFAPFAPLAHFHAPPPERDR
jgi:hypothetical protein